MKTNIPELMKKYGIRQRDALRKTDLGGQTIHDIAHGGANVAVKNLFKFCQAVGIAWAEVEISEAEQ